MRKVLPILVCCLLLGHACLAQQIPAVEENIPFLVTFGKDGDKSWGDDSFSQTFFFSVLKFQEQPVYIRVFDPESSGDHDEKKEEYNTKTKFSVYGGNGCFTDKGPPNNPNATNKKSGNLLSSKTFESEPSYNGKWYTFGPFNPTEGELVNDYGGYVFKIIAEGINGDDGNLYRYFFSSSSTENKPVEGGNTFTFKYTFRLHDNANNTAHLYPYVDENVISVKVSNFDFDNDGEINIVSMAKKSERSKPSGDNVWAVSEHTIVDLEKKTTLDVQLIKNKTAPVKNNNVSLYVTNQYGNLLPIFAVPIGGTANHNYKIDFNKKKKITPY